MSVGFGSLDELERRLRDYRRAQGNEGSTNNQTVAQPQAAVQPLTYEGHMPAEAYRSVEPQRDPLQDKINRYLEENLELRIPPEFAKYESVIADLKPVKYDFKDNELMHEAGIHLERYSAEFIAALGRSVIPMISSGFSKIGMAALFVLAYHLKKPGANNYLLYGAEDLNFMTDSLYEEYPDRVLRVCGSLEPITPVDDAKEASVYAYLAASMLRLFTKAPGNYIEAWSHIVDGYSRFYGQDADVQLPQPAEAAMRTLSEWFSLDRKAKVTLYRILYMSNSSQEGSGLKKFLYDIHLTNTGMHIVNILVGICKVLNCSPGLVLNIINNWETSKQVGCLVHLLDILADTSAGRQRRMWRYGRLFDETFMADIQTKVCPKLVYILAAALQMEAPRTHGGILDIVQLANVSQENQVLCKAAAKHLLVMIKEKKKKGGPVHKAPTWCGLGRVDVRSLTPASGEAVSSILQLGCKAVFMKSTQK